LTGWTLANGTRPTLFAGSVPLQRGEDDNCIDSGHLWQHYGIRAIAAAAAEAILDRHSRSLALDVTPYLLYASGPAVDGLLTSSVSDYVEFKSVEGLLFAEKQQRDTNGIAVSLSRVPCSKNDVFASKLLSPMDKHRLMKFLQTVGDYASAEALKAQEQLETEEAVDEVHHVNERQLKQGRSLQRPQNKAVASADLQRLQDFCQSPSQISFESYLRDHQKLPVPLSNLVRYALALDTADVTYSGSTTNATTTTTVAAGIRQLCAHMMALGQFGGTAFLVPLYGSGELAQAFCRSAAVYGATYLLRREPLGIVLQQDNDDEDGNNQDCVHSRCVCDIVLNGPAARSLSDDSPETSTTSRPNKRIACSHVVVPRGSIHSSQSGTSHQRVV
jgi:Rab proteins geranylgeranyltransferase component A